MDYKITLNRQAVVSDDEVVKIFRNVSLDLSSRSMVCVLDNTRKVLLFVSVANLVTIEPI